MARDSARLFGIRFYGPEHAPSPAEVFAAFPASPGLYLHFPFCLTICPFCPYNKVRFTATAATEYGIDLEREASMYSAWPGAFSSLYVGGGTPTLGLDALQNLLARIPVTGERAIEVLPLHMTRDGAARLRALGFNYVSLGVQSFSDAVLRRLRRPGTARANAAAVEVAVGEFECVDVDLMFDAGFDNPRTLLDDLELCFRYGVDQVSTYPLIRFGYTPFGAGRHHRRREHALLHQATELAHSHGYARRSVWTFSRGSRSYTSITRPYYLGWGAGAASFAGELFFVNHFGLAQYRRALDEGRLPVARVARLPRPAAAAYRAFWQAYTGTLPVNSPDPLLNHAVTTALGETARRLGWLERSGGTLTLTRSGYDRYHDLERWVTRRFIEPLWAQMMAEHQSLSPSAE